MQSFFQTKWIGKKLSILDAWILYCNSWLYGCRLLVKLFKSFQFEDPYLPSPNTWRYCEFSSNTSQQLSLQSYLNIFKIRQVTNRGSPRLRFKARIIQYRDDDVRQKVNHQLTMSNFEISAAHWQVFGPRGMHHCCWLGKRLCWRDRKLDQR